MKHRNRITQFAAVAAIVAGTAGVAAAQGQAAPSQKHPQLRHGVLKIEGTAGSERIALRLKAGQPGILQIDFGDDGQAEFQVKRDQVMAVMDSIPGVVCPKPEGAFYVFPDISCAFGKSHGGARIGNDVDLCNALLEAKGVACVPGSAFGEPRALRISYTCPTAQLPEGLRRFQEFFAELK